VAIGVGIAGCSLLFPFDGYGPGTPPPDAQADSGDAGELDASPACGLRVPDRPAEDDPSSEDLDLTLALESFDVVGADGGQTPGLNLDGLCTCPDPGPCASATLSCDADGGVDNGVGDFLVQLSSFGKLFDQAQGNTYLAQGQYFGALFVLHHYNGTPNDRSVQFATYGSDGTVVIDDAGHNARPRLDGTDVWTIDRNSVVGASGPPFIPLAVDPDAYVANGVLVSHANVPLTIPTFGQNLPLKVQGGIIMAPLVREGSLWKFRGAMTGGRVSTQTYLTTLAAVPDPFVKGGWLCGNSATYRTLKPQLCAAADIVASPADDGQGKKCDAFSFGMRFNAVTAVVGPFGEGLPLGDAGCGQGYTDDCTP
jgi:hypothetical protein